MRLYADEPSGSNILPLWVIFEGLTMVVGWSSDIQTQSEGEILGNTYQPALQPKLYQPYRQTQLSGLANAKIEYPHNAAARALPTFQQQSQTVLQQAATLQPPWTSYGSAFQPQLYQQYNPWMYPVHQTQQWVQPPYQLHQTQQWVQPPYQLLQTQQWVQPQYHAYEPWYRSPHYGSYIEPSSQQQTDDFERLYQDPENAFRLAQDLMNRLDTLIETIRPIDSTLQDTVRFSLFHVVAQLLSRIASVSVALISQRNNSDMDNRVDDFLHNAEDKSYQLKTMLIEMQSFASEHVVVSTPPKNLPFQQPQVSTLTAPIVPWVNPIGRDLGKPVGSLGNTDMR